MKINLYDFLAENSINCDIDGNLNVNIKDLYEVFRKLKVNYINEISSDIPPIAYIKNINSDKILAINTSKQKEGDLFIPVYAKTINIEKIILDFEQEINSKQAKIDDLMLEYCPNEMTELQLENYAKHLKIVNL